MVSAHHLPASPLFFSSGCSVELMDSFSPVSLDRLLNLLSRFSACFFCLVSSFLRLSPLYDLFPNLHSLLVACSSEADASVREGNAQNCPESRPEYVI